jgi:hypothetical protein
MAAYQAAQDQAAQTLEDEAVRRAYEGVERPVTVAGKRELVREYSDTLLIFLLKGLRPAKYRERYDVAVEAGDSLVQAIARGRARALALSAGPMRGVERGFSRVPWSKLGSDPCQKSLAVAYSASVRPG